MYVSACRKSEHIWFRRSELASIFQATHLILHLGLTDWAFSVPSLESSPPQSPPLGANRIAHDHDGGVAANIEDTSPIAKNVLQDNVQPEAAKWTRDASYTSSVGPSVDAAQWWLKLRTTKVALLCSPTSWVKHLTSQKASAVVWPISSIHSLTLYCSALAVACHVCTANV